MCKVVSKNIAFLNKNHCFPKKNIVFQHVHFFIPLFWNEKLSLVVIIIYRAIFRSRLFKC